MSCFTHALQDIIKIIYSKIAIRILSEAYLLFTTKMRNNFSIEQGSFIHKFVEKIM